MPVGLAKEDLDDKILYVKCAIYYLSGLLESRECATTLLFKGDVIIRFKNDKVKIEITNLTYENITNDNFGFKRIKINENCEAIGTIEKLSGCGLCESNKKQLYLFLHKAADNITVQIYNFLNKTSGVRDVKTSEW